jgi:hypothetical protein
MQTISAVFCPSRKLFYSGMKLSTRV